MKRLCLILPLALAACMPAPEARIVVPTDQGEVTCAGEAAQARVVSRPEGVPDLVAQAICTDPGARDLSRPG